MNEDASDKEDDADQIGAEDDNPKEEALNNQDQKDEDEDQDADLKQARLE